MKLRSTAIVLLALVQNGPAANTPAGGTVRGRIRIVDRGKVVASRPDLYVYLEPVHRRGRTLPGAGNKAEIRQQMRGSNPEFVPHVLVIPTGTVVAFPNYDIQEHNVFSPSDPPGQFDIGRYKTDHKGNTHEFDVPAEVDIFCDIHKQMSAKIKVVDTTYVVAVGATGEFAFDHVAPGTYKVIGWLPDNKDEARSPERVTVTEGGQVQLGSELHLQLDVLTPKPHTRKDGTQYPIYGK